MKKLIIISILCMSFAPIHIINTENKTISTFCEGWNDGYGDGWCDGAGYGCVRPVPPACPVPYVGEDSYRGGYKRGFKQGVKDR